MFHSALPSSPLGAFQFSEPREASAQRALHSPQRRVQLCGDFPKAETLKVGQFDHGSLEFGEARELPPEAVAAFTAFDGALRFDGSDRAAGVRSALVKSRAIRSSGLPSKAIDEMPPRDEHDPCDELRAMRIEPFSRAPQANEDLLHRVIRLSSRTQYMPRRLINKRCKAAVELFDRGFV